MVVSSQAGVEVVVVDVADVVAAAIVVGVEGMDKMTSAAAAAAADMAFAQSGGVQAGSWVCLHSPEGYIVEASAVEECADLVDNRPMIETLRAGNQTARDGTQEQVP